MDFVGCPSYCGHLRQLGLLWVLRETVSNVRAHLGTLGSQVLHASSDRVAYFSQSVHFVTRWALLGVQNLQNTRSSSQRDGRDGNERREEEGREARGREQTLRGRARGTSRGAATRAILGELPGHASHNLDVQESAPAGTAVAAARAREVRGQRRPLEISCLCGPLHRGGGAHEHQKMAL